MYDKVITYLGSIKMRDKMRKQKTKELDDKTPSFFITCPWQSKPAPSWPLNRFVGGSAILGEL